MNTEKVWVLTIDTRYGPNTTLWRDENEALQVAYEYVVENWERYFGDPEDPDTPEEDKMPEDRQEAIDQYFDEVDEDTYYLELMSIN